MSAQEGARTNRFDAIDRIVAGEESSVPEVFRYIRALQHEIGEGAPLCERIARRLAALEHRTVFLFSGFVVPDLYPQGENDGPLGTLALARALQRLGARSIVWVDPELLDTVRWLAGELRCPLPIHPIRISALKPRAAEPDAVIAIEKPGINSAGRMHTFDGAAIRGGSISIDALFNAWRERGALTLGIGDRGNEIGFGKWATTVQRLRPDTTTCRCGCGGGVVSTTETDLLLPAAVSNWGAYGLAAALALITSNASLLLHPTEERRLLQVAAVRGCVDGVYRRCGFGVDGIDGDTSVDVVRSLHDLVTQPEFLR